MIKWFFVNQSRIRSQGRTRIYFWQTALGLLWLNQHVNLFYVIRKFLPAKIFGKFLFDSSSFINTNVNVRNSYFGTITVYLQVYNWYKLGKSTKLGIFLILKEGFKFTYLWKFYYKKKAPALIFLKQIKCVAHDNFSVFFLNTKSFRHGLKAVLYNIEWKVSFSSIHDS